MLIVGINKYELDREKDVIRVFLDHEGEGIGEISVDVKLRMLRLDDFYGFKTLITSKYNHGTVPGGGGTVMERVDVLRLKESWRKWRTIILNEIGE